MLRAILVLAASAASLKAQDKSRTIDVLRSTITIHVGKGGLLSAAGHERLVSAPISRGVIDDSAAPHAEFTVQTAKITVKPDPNHTLQPTALLHEGYLRLKKTGKRQQAQATAPTPWPWTAEPVGTRLGLRQAGARPRKARIPDRNRHRRAPAL